MGVQKLSKFWKPATFGVFISGGFNIILFFLKRTECLRSYAIDCAANPALVFAAIGVISAPFLIPLCIFLLDKPAFRERYAWIITVYAICTIVVIIVLSLMKTSNGVWSGPRF